MSMDGPSTNWKFYDHLVAHRSEHQLPKLVNIGSCSLHIIHGVFKTGAEGAFHFLHDTPARRDNYLSITGSSKFPLFFCATWCR